MFFIDTLKVRKTKKSGRGVFATADIAPGTVLGDYFGRLILEKDENEQTQGLYGMPLDAKTTILADPKTTGIHLINHSCAQNCGMYPVGDRTVYVTLRKIHKGEELTVNYLIGVPSRQCNPCRHECHCGEDFCQGTMHCADKRVDAYLAFEKQIQKKQKWSKPRTLPARYGEWLPSLAVYPQQITDYAIYPIFSARGSRPFSIVGKPALSTIRARMRLEGRPCRLPALGITILAVVGREIRATHI
ncbi:MAG: SET domain-containing protein-lysine N-methyltransferase [Candidatus Ryanbacteria bacterium]|nr:SET domain-containing protein-lysine N-methyltransferase [Candidatus Ryanbacteria bacterium]